MHHAFVEHQLTHHKPCAAHRLQKHSGTPVTGTTPRKKGVSHNNTAHSAALAQLHPFCLPPALGLVGLKRVGLAGSSSFCLNRPSMNKLLDLPEVAFRPGPKPNDPRPIKPEPDPACLFLSAARACCWRMRFCAATSACLRSRSWIASPTFLFFFGSILDNTDNSEAEFCLSKQSVRKCAWATFEYERAM